MKKLTFFFFLVFLVPLSLIFAQSSSKVTVGPSEHTVSALQIPATTCAGVPFITIPKELCNKKLNINSATDCSGCAKCGDGVVTYVDTPPIEYTELCDDEEFLPQFDTYEPKVCTSDCKVLYCGDGIVTNNSLLKEKCDGNLFADEYQQYELKGCTDDCQVHYCGDGVYQEDIGEQCDQNDPIGVNCRENCRINGCGDGFIDDPETCDPFIKNGEVGYQADCRAAGNFAECTFCGDNKIQSEFEVCDGSDRGDISNPHATCKSDCSGFNPYCGDGIPGNTPSEQCDDGDTDNTDECTNDCRNLACGDGITGTGEECDDQNTDNFDSCSNSCRNAVCGDGIPGNTAGEDCDDGNSVDTDSCTNNCKNARCGDSIIRQSVEECDDGNAVNNDSCSNICKNARCGDGIIQTYRGEQCELPNTNGTLGRGCNAYCQNTCVKDSCGRPCGDANWGKACPVIKCESEPYLPNCNTYDGKPESYTSCKKIEKRGPCNDWQHEEWCTRRFSNSDWDYLHKKWVDQRCSGGRWSGATFTCFKASNYTTYSCTTPLVFNFNLDRPVKYLADDGKSTFNLAAKNQEKQDRTDWPTSETPWLALDRDGDGLVTSGSELFGTATNIGVDNEYAHFGFEALAILDANKDENIDSADPEFSKLLLWSDINADRISTKDEIKTLPEHGIKSISLKFKLATRCDDRGNCENERAEFIWIDESGKERRGEVVDINLLNREVYDGLSE